MARVKTFSDGGSLLPGDINAIEDYIDTVIATLSGDTRFPTQPENDALAGTNGSPSGSNRYVTDSDARNSDERVPVDGSVTADKLAGKAVGTAALADLAVTGAKTANATLTLAKLATGHGMSFNTWNYGGSGVQTPANTTNLLAQTGFTARDSGVLILAGCLFNEIRGGVGNGILSAAVSGVGSGGTVWNASAGFGGFALAAYGANVAPGGHYTAQALAAVANEPITLQARGPAFLLVFDLA